MDDLKANVLAIAEDIERAESGTYEGEDGGGPFDWIHDQLEITTVIRKSGKHSTLDSVEVLATYGGPTIRVIASDQSDHQVHIVGHWASEEFDTWVDAPNLVAAILECADVGEEVDR